MKRTLEMRKVLGHVHHQPTKKLDLRNSSRHSAFCCQKFEFGLIHDEENITAHASDTPKEVKQKYEEVKEVLESGLNELHQKDVPDYAIIHFYMNCEGMEQSFMLTGAGPHRKTLKQLRNGDGLDEIIDKFAQMIQSGRNVTLDDHTKIVFYAFIPPMEYR